jgi:hypothetical protein
MAEIYSESIANSHWKVGHTTVGTVVQQLCESDEKVYKNILLRAPGPSDPVPNTDPVWISPSPDLTCDTSHHGGLILLPGQSLSLPLQSANLIFVRSTAEGQIVSWTCA